MIPTRTNTTTNSARITCSAALNLNQSAGAMGKGLPRDGRLLEDFRPILQELLQALVGQWVIEQRIEHLERHRADMRARQRRFHHVRRRPQRGRQNLRLESVILVNLYDVAEEIRLSDLPPLTGGTRLSPPSKPSAPAHVRFERPPVIEPLPPLSLPTGERFEATLQYYDYGVVSVLLRSAFSGSWEELQRLAGSWVSGTIFDDLCRNTIRERLARVSAALVKPYDNWLSEDYAVIHLHSISGTTNGADLRQEHGAEISQIVRGETTPLADQERTEVLQGYMSYYPNDLDRCRMERGVCL